MTPNYTNVHIQFSLNGFHYNHSDLQELAYSYVKEGAVYEQELGNFLLDWLDGNDYILVKTSGSTGRPKQLKIKKDAMVNSAIATGNFFNLQPGDSAIHCLPSSFIAGKMMLVRALILGLKLDLVEPKAIPFINTQKQFDFCAFTPMQLKNSVNNLTNIKTIIVGGGNVSSGIINSLQNIKTTVYETYGMTETVSHIAVKKLNNFSDSKALLKNLCFETLPNITISQDTRDCLVIDAPYLSKEKIVTNDIVKLHTKTTFEWLGRYDNIINSGGIKLHPEQIENKLKSKIPNRFFIASKPDDALGQKAILILEGNKNNFDFSVLESLDMYEKPKDIFFIPKFQETKSGKIQRVNTLNKLNL